jgi:hypothetical protein
VGELIAVSLVDLTRTAAGLLFSSYDTSSSMWVVLASILTAVFSSVTVRACTVAEVAPAS